MLDQTTKRKLDSARQILVGKVPDPKAQVEQITTALIYKFMDDMDKENEEVGLKTQFFVDDWKKFSWTKILDNKLSGQERLDLYVQAITNMPKNPHIPQLFRNIFKGAFLPYNDPRTLSLFLKEINEFNYEHSENLGNAFEYLLSILGSQGDAGQFRTPRHIIDFIVEVVDPKKNETILDPACGTAGFLISAYKHILKQNKEKALTPDEKLKLMNNLAGYDISPDMVKLALVNMYLHGFPEPKIHEYDTLSSEKRWDETFDVIMANPPFMTPKGGIVPHKRFSIQANRAEVLFVDYIVEHLTIKGRAGIIVPEGVIFQSNNAYTQLRKKLVEDGLFAVVSLPAGVFNPYAGVKTSILLFDNEISKKTKNFLFLKIQNDGFDLGAQRREHSKNDLPLALEIIKKYKSSLNDRNFSEDEKQIAHIIAKEKIIATGDYNLSGDRYKEVISFANQKWKMVELGELEKQEKITFLRGQGISKKDIVENGKNKCVHYGEIYTVYQPIIENVVSKTNLEGKILSKKGDVLIPSTTTADAMGIAVARALNEDGVILGGDINIIRTKNEYILAAYLAYLISNSSVKNQLAVFAKGINILHLSNSDLRKLKIPLPPIEVQKEIIEQIEVKQNAIDHAKAIIQNLERERRYFGQLLRKLEGVEWVEFNQIVKTITPPRKIQKNNFGISGKYPIIDQSQNEIAGWTDDEKALINHDKPVIIFGDHTCSIKYSEIPFAQGADGIKILTTAEKLLPKFLYFFLKTGVVDSTGYKRHYTELKEIKIPLPSLETQKKLVAEAEKEQEVINANKQLIEIMEQKISDVLSEI
jgi:type I restriction enzyme M protein